MYLFRLQPMYFDQYNWQVSTAFAVTSSTGVDKFYDDSNKVVWQPFTPYALSSVVRRGQNLYYSAKESNTDDPFYNWIGSTPEGNNTWIKGRSLHDYDCINLTSPGATQRTNVLSLTIYPKKMAQASDITKFYGESSENYLILTGLRGASVVLAFYNSGNVLLQTKTVVSAESPITGTRIVWDKSSLSEPELPVFISDTVMSLMPLGTDKIIISITPDVTGSIAKVSGIFVGNAYKIAKTESSGISLGAIDYSRITYDPWGKLGSEPGKKAKTMQVSLPMPHILAQREEKILRLLQSCRATPTIFYCVNNLILDSFVSSLTLVYGLVKSSSINEDHYNKRTLDIEIDGIPVDYNP